MMSCPRSRAAWVSVRLAVPAGVDVADADAGDPDAGDADVGDDVEDSVIACLAPGWRRRRRG